MNLPIILISLLQRVLQIIIDNIHADNIQDVIFIFLLVDTMVQACYLLHQKKCIFVHSGSTMEVVAKGGRKWKKRRKGQFQQSYLLALSTHHSVPKLANIQIMAGNYEGEDITYNMSWRKLQEVKAVSKKVARKASELVIPFLEGWKENNLRSIVEWAVDEHKCIQHVFVCPAYMEKVLSYMHPVILVDAAHLKSAYKGTIFIYSGLTGNDKAFFGIWD